MKYNGPIHRRKAYFSKWKNAGYAIFAGLGREILISVLSVHMFKNILLKSSKKGLIVNDDKSMDRDGDNIIEFKHIFQANNFVSVILGKVYAVDLT
ncbi:hypothetical protein LJC12_03060 [Odoribacter sp. OttesenSCG-928-J03]|nr:hypothetical protein [Odoribacter sp. OttesenSCG-928-J03]